jgi:hypothetical protein
MLRGSTRSRSTSRSCSAKALTRNEFEDLQALTARISAFEEPYRQIAQPFESTFTRAKRDALLTRLAAREPHLRLAA